MKVVDSKSTRSMPCSIFGYGTMLDISVPELCIVANSLSCRLDGPEEGLWCIREYAPHLALEWSPWFTPLSPSNNNIIDVYKWQIVAPQYTVIVVSQYHNWTWMQQSTSRTLLKCAYHQCIFRIVESHIRLHNIILVFHSIYILGL